jgi:hypothetical protein
VSLKLKLPENQFLFLKKVENKSDFYKGLDNKCFSPHETYVWYLCFIVTFIKKKKKKIPDWQSGMPAYQGEALSSKPSATNNKQTITKKP